MSLQSRLDEIYMLGPGPGAQRPAYTAGEDAAHALVRGWMDETELEVEVDRAGNLFGRLRGDEPELPEIWTGSHLDSVPAGGRFDGPLGVLGGLEAVVRAGRRRRTLTVVAFRDEEGWRFGRGCFGSRALCGQLAPGELDTPDADGITLGAAIGRSELPAGGWLSAPPAAYLELHIEQGPVLAELGAPLGIVTSIVGLARLGVTFGGREGHAGTTPMRMRRDALCAAAQFVLAVRDAALSVGGGAVATVGKLVVEPGAANVIPNNVSALVDARAPGEAQLSALLREIEAAAPGAEIERLRRTTPVAMAAPVREALREALAARGLPAPELHSGAGHDAGVLGAAGVDAGMVFVRSANGGISHSPDEWTEPDDVALAVSVLGDALGRLADK